MGLNINGNVINNNSGGFDVNTGIGDAMDMQSNGVTRFHRQTANNAAFSGNYALYYTGYYDINTYDASQGSDDYRGSNVDTGSPGGTRGRFTCPHAGLYMARFWSIVATGNGNRWHGYLSVNGGTWSSLAPTYTAYHYGAGGSWKTATVQIIREASAGDWFTFWVSDSGQFHGGYHSGFSFIFLG